MSSRPDPARPAAAAGTYRLFLLKDKASHALVRHILWPTPHDERAMSTLGFDRMPALDTQAYYVEELDLSDARQRALRGYMDACIVHQLNMQAEDVARSRRDWLYALFFNYDRCGMDEDLNRALDFVLHKYEPLEQLPASFQEWTFVRRSLAFVRRQRHTHVKIFLLLAVMAREPELANVIAGMCPGESFPHAFPILKQLVDSVLMSPFNRCNVSYRLQWFIKEAASVCFMDMFMPSTNTAATAAAADPPAAADA